MKYVYRSWLVMMGAFLIVGIAMQMWYVVGLSVIAISAYTIGWISRDVRGDEAGE